MNEIKTPMARGCPDRFTVWLRRGFVIVIASFPWFAAYDCVTAAVVDPTFARQITRDRVETVVVQPDGRLLVGGSFQISGASPNLMRLLPDGAHDSTFAPTSGTARKVTRLALQPDGKVLLGNKGGIDGGYPSIGLSRFLPDGSKDPSFEFRLPTNSINSGWWSGFWTTALTVQPDGKILVAGRFERDHFDYWYWSGVSLRRLLPNGSEDSFFTFPSPSPQEIGVLVLLPDQRLLVAGDQLVRMNADGSADAGFVRTILSSGEITCCAIQPDGKIVVAGTFTNIQGQARCRIARMMPNGQLDASFNPPVSTREGDPDDIAVRALAVQGDGRILVGGDFETMNGLPYPTLARLNTNGSLDTNFPSLIRRDEEEDTVAVRTIVMQDGERALVGGEHMVVSGSSDVTALFRMYLGETSPRLSVVKLGGGAVQLTFANPGGYDFAVVSGTNPSLPISEWSVLGAATNVGGNLYQFTHQPPASEAHRFYRLNRMAAE